jgi:BirA family biotin operon repressor/biotin-[acetyl-CoA-carboxylase] ligase
VAEEQTAGQGRRGRSWHSEPEAGLYCSVILRPQMPTAKLPHVTLALGLATAEAVRDATGVECDLRWPNDLLIGRRKVAGILTQLEEGAAVNAGIGVNVNHERFPDALAGVATSLRIASGRPHPREGLLIALLRAVDRNVDALERSNREIRERYARASSYVQGKHVAIELEGRELRGVTEGLTEEGFLLLRAEDGRTVEILAGGVRPLEPATLE